MLHRDEALHILLRWTLRHITLQDAVGWTSLFSLKRSACLGQIHTTHKPVEISSNYNKFKTFTIYLPCAFTAHVHHNRVKSTRYPYNWLLSTRHLIEPPSLAPARTLRVRPAEPEINEHTPDATRASSLNLW